MTIKLRIILDHSIDVFREIEINSTSTLLTLHEYIVQIFDLEKNEMAAFYLTDEVWEQGQEIPLLAMQNNTQEMKDLLLNDIVQSKQRLLYVNNFLLLWRFMIEIIEIDEDKTEDQPQTLLSFGTMPQESPNIQFVANNNDLSMSDDDFDDDFDEFNEFENYEGF